MLNFGGVAGHPSNAIRIIFNSSSSFIFPSNLFPGAFSQNYPQKNPKSVVPLFFPPPKNYPKRIAVGGFNPFEKD